MLGIGSVVEGGFRLLREHPLAMLVWGAIYTVANLGMLLLMRPMFALQATATPGAAPDPAAMFAAIGPLFGYELLLVVVMVVLWTAAFRAVMRPQERMAAYLRLGLDELRIVAMSVVMGVLCYAALVVAGIAISIVTAAIFASGSRGAAIVVAIALGLVLTCAMTWLLVRLSLAGPVTVYRRRIAIGEAWQLSRGNFWSLFLGYLVIYILIFVFATIVSILTMGSYMLNLMRSMGNPLAAQQLAQSQVDRFSSFDPMLLLTLLGGAVIAMLWIALGAGASAHAARTLIGEQTDYEETFA